MAILLNPINVNIEINDDIDLMCISEEFFNRAPRETYLLQSQYEALRDYFQAERDEELGRWRDPQNPDWICYGRGSSRDTVHVINEYDGLPYMLERDQVAYADSEFSAVAQRYFEAHPKPKPWDAAQPDEIWALTINGYSAPYLRNWYGTWTNSTSDVSVGDGTITACRRIWPEGEASE